MGAETKSQKRELSEGASDAHSEIVRYQHQAKAIAHVLATTGLVDEINRMAFQEMMILIEYLMERAQDATNLFCDEARLLMQNQM